MSKSACLLSWLLLLATNGFSQKFSPLNVTFPDSLKEGANSIVLVDRTTLEIESESAATLDVYRDVLILNSDGVNDGYFFASYDRFSTIKDAYVGLFDVSGKKISVYDQDKMKDYIANVEDAMVTDYRLLVLSATATSFPYHVILHYQKTFKGFLYLPQWHPQQESQSVLSATYLMTTRKDFGVRYKLNNAVCEMNHEVTGNEEQYRWEIQNKPALKLEDYGPAFYDQAISLTIVPEKFKIDGHEGSLNNWSDLGKWYYSLAADRQQLNEETKAKISSLIDGISDPRLRVKKIYEYLQHTTRYFGVELGIGGWQPVDAAFVAKNGYGDCKALSNYMQALLKEAGINSYQVLIKSGEDASDIDVSFPNSQFDHIILVVPLKADTIWLECTSQSLPFGFISAFTENRHSLMVKPEGSEIVKTRSTSSVDNTIRTSFSVDLSNPKYPDSKLRMHFTGNEATDDLQPLAELSDDKKMKEIRENIGLSNFNLSSFSYQPFNRDSVCGDINLSMVLPEFSQVSSSRIFFSPYLIPVCHSPIEQKGKRKFPVKFAYPFEKSVEGSFKLPEGYKVESMPKDASFEDESLSFESHFEQRDSSVFAKYHFSIKHYTIPSESFDSFSKSLNQIINEQKKKIVLVKTT